MKKCTVKITQKDFKEADFYGVFQESYVRQELVVGEIGGTFAFPVAVVDLGEGLQKVPVERVSDIREATP